METKRFLFVLGASFTLFLLPELFFHNAMLYIVGGMIGGVLQKVLGGVFEAQQVDSFFFPVWLILLAGTVFLYYRLQNRTVKYLNIILVFGLLYVVDFMVYEILPNNLKPQLITGISVFVKSLVLSLIIYFNGRQKKKATH